MDNLAFATSTLLTPALSVRPASSCCSAFSGTSVCHVPSSRRANLYMQQNDAPDSAEDDAPSDTYVPAAEASPTSNPIQAVTKRMSLVKRLLKLSSFTLRGQEATDAQAAAVDDIVMALEEMNPTSMPVNSDKIDGLWFLAYSNAKLFQSGKFFTAAIKPVLQLSQVRQRINVNDGTLVTEGDILLFPATSATVTTTTRIIPIGGERLEVTVEKTTVTGGKLLSTLDLGGLSFDVPVEQILSRLRNMSPETYIDTYYLDDDIRISRSKEGKLYVYTRMDD